MCRWRGQWRRFYNALINALTKALKGAEMKKPQEKVEVILAKAHTHAGKPYAKGDKIKVRPSQKVWLAANNVIAAEESK